MRKLWIIWFVCLMQFNLALLADEGEFPRQDGQVLSDVIDGEEDGGGDSFQDALEQALEEAAQEAAQQSTTEEAAESFFESLLQSMADFFTPDSGDSGTEDSGTTTGSGGGNSYAKGEDQHEKATIAIAVSISQDTGAPAQNYAAYASKLADTLGQLNQAALARVLGENSPKMP